MSGAIPGPEWDSSYEGPAGTLAATTHVHRNPLWSGRPGGPWGLKGWTEEQPEEGDTPCHPW